MLLLRISTLLVVTAVSALPHMARAQRIRSPVRIDSLARGIPLYKPVRFEMVDVLAGDRSVLGLFKPTPRSAPGTVAYYRNAQDSVVLELNRGTQVAALLELLHQERTDRLRIVLRDPNPSVLRTIYEVGSRVLPRYQFGDTLEVTVRDLPPVCNVVTQIVYESINEILRERLERSAATQQPVAVDSIFGLLVTDRIDEFIDFIGGLGVVEQDAECMRTLDFLKWVRGSSAEGFVRGHYEIAGGVREALDVIAKTLASTLEEWDERDVQIDATGYGDRVPVDSTVGIELDVSKTGVARLFARQIEVYHGGCDDDRLTGSHRVFVPPPTSHRVGQRIWNNCELGAVRAYVASVYLASKLPREHLHFRYATGGVSTEFSDDGQNRRVGITLTVLAGGERDSPRRQIP